MMGNAPTQAHDVGLCELRAAARIGATSTTDRVRTVDDRNETARCGRGISARGEPELRAKRSHPGIAAKPGKLGTRQVGSRTAGIDGGKPLERFERVVPVAESRVDHRLPLWKVVVSGGERLGLGPPAADRVSVAEIPLGTCALSFHPSESPP